MDTTTKLDWSLFELQEKDISIINNELYNLRKQKYPEYRDSYYRYYNEFGMRGMIGDLYRKFDRLKIMSESYTDSEIVSKEKEITDQFYDIISYCQLQLYWLRREKWEKNESNNMNEAEKIFLGVQKYIENKLSEADRVYKEESNDTFCPLEDIIVSIIRSKEEPRKGMKYVY